MLLALVLLRTFTLFKRGNKVCAYFFTCATCTGAAPSRYLLYLHGRSTFALPVLLALVQRTLYNMERKVGHEQRNVQNIAIKR